MLRKLITNLLRNDLKLIMESPVSFMVFGCTDFTIEFANTRVLKILNKTWEEIEGKPFFYVFPELKKQGYEEIFNNIIQTGEIFTALEMPLSIEGSINGYINFTLQPLKDTAGRASFIAGIASNVTELVLAREKIAEEKTKYYSIIENMDPGFALAEVIFNAGKPVDILFLEANRAFVNLTGLMNATGRRLKELMPDIEDFWLRFCGKVALTGRHMSAIHRVKSMNRIYQANAFRVGDEKSTKVAVLFYDVTSKIHEEHVNRSFAELLKSEVAHRTKELEASNDVLRQFTHVISHDLKEPVRKIKFMLSLLEYGIKDHLAPATAEYLHKIRRSADRMNDMMQGIFDYSKIDAYDEKCRYIDLNRLIGHIKDDLEILISSVNGSIIVAGLPKTSGVYTHLYQLFNNLIINSFRFAREGTPCAVTITGELKTIAGKKFSVIHVRDNGIGIEHQYREKIFQPFYTIPVEEKERGTGMGLTICRKIAERHGGSITARGNPDNGAEFTIILPHRQKKSREIDIHGNIQLPVPGVTSY